ncbi:hypothetical protein DIS24_g2337 [Lasiodiplodia hormozganensis]|uniref:Uncharacterized protein n=1 Tax=Lasiodiplodia hormozganensis TaxID=869390 RepID=A0AA40D4Y5_9PEZI|nr:hypothetical protein DIS24_g2337 [Lasiodiplodia hormozganensis]
MRMGMKTTDIDGAVMEMAAAAKKGLNPLKSLKECKLTPNPNAVLSLEWLDYAFQTDEEAATIVKQLANERPEAEQKLHTHSYTPKPVNLKAKEIKRTPKTLRKKMGFERTQETFTSSAKESARMAMAYDLVDPDDISSDSSDEEEDDESWHFLKDDLEHRQDWRLQEDAMQYKNDGDWVDQTTEQNLAAYV